MYFNSSLCPVQLPSLLTGVTPQPSPNKLAAQSETIFQGTPPNRGVEAGFKPKQVKSWWSMQIQKTTWWEFTGLNSSQVKGDLGNNWNLPHDYWSHHPSFSSGPFQPCSPPIFSCPSTWASSLMVNDDSRMPLSCPGCSLLYLLIL